MYITYNTEYIGTDHYKYHRTVPNQVHEDIGAAKLVLRCCNNALSAFNHHLEIAAHM